MDNIEEKESGRPGGGEEVEQRPKERPFLRRRRVAVGEEVVELRK